MARRTTTKATPAPEATDTAPVATEPQETAPEKVTLVGRLCADPVLRHTKSGKAVTTIRLALNNPDAEPSFHSVVVWERTAEVVCEYLRKGRTVEVSGRTQERSYEASDGTERQVTEIVASRVDFLSRRAASPSPADDKQVA
jgi:single-strand DNA-binding protein